MKATDSSQRQMIDDQDGHFHDDLLLALGFLFVADLVVLVTPPELVAIRTITGVPLLFFLPGYALQAALYPGRVKGIDRLGRTGIDGREYDTMYRIALAFGLSVALLPPLSLLHSTIGLGFTVPAIILSISVFVVGGTAVAMYRRHTVPEEDRYQPKTLHWIGVQLNTLLSGGAENRTVHVTLSFVMIVAVLTLVFALSTPISGESYTSFAVLTENETGDLVASGYPTQMTTGTSEPLVVAVENHETRQVDYTVVVTIQRVSTSGASVSVLEAQELTRIDMTLESGERWQRKHTVSPTMTGENLRLSYLLYRGVVPANPGPDTAYRNLHLWVTVTEG